MLFLSNVNLQAEAIDNYLLYLYFRPTSQFSSGKFPQLPGIGASSPQPSESNAVVPAASSATRHSMEGFEPEDRLRMLETRINVSEKSNRALLEEVSGEFL